MRHQNGPQGRRPGSSLRSLWQQIRLPLSVSLALGLIIYTLTTLAFGTNLSTTRLCTKTPSGTNLLIQPITNDSAGTFGSKGVKSVMDGKLGCSLVDDTID